MMRTNTDLLDTIARRLGVSFPDLRDWCPLLSLQALLEVDNRAFPVEEWNRALAYLLGRPCAFSYVFEAKAYTKTVILLLSHRKEERLRPSGHGKGT